MSYWNIAQYRNKAVHYARDFLALYPMYRDNIEALRRWIAAVGPDHYWTFVKKHEAHLCDVIFATPARKRAALARFKRQHRNAHAPAADVLVGMLILAGWQTFRKAVLQYDGIARTGPDPPAKISNSYKTAALFIAREKMCRSWTQWPSQWGDSPFDSDTRSAENKRRDYIPEIDDFNLSA